MSSSLKTFLNGENFYNSDIIRLHGSLPLSAVCSGDLVTDYFKIDGQRFVIDVLDDETTITYAIGETEC